MMCDCRMSTRRALGWKELIFSSAVKAESETRLSARAILAHTQQPPRVEGLDLDVEHTPVSDADPCALTTPVTDSESRLSSHGRRGMRHSH